MGVPSMVTDNNCASLQDYHAGWSLRDICILASNAICCRMPNTDNRRGVASPSDVHTSVPLSCMLPSAAWTRSHSPHFLTHSHSNAPALTLAESITVYALASTHKPHRTRRLHESMNDCPKLWSGMHPANFDNIRVQYPPCCLQQQHLLLNTTQSNPGEGPIDSVFWHLEHRRSNPRHQRTAHLANRQKWLPRD